MKPFAIAAVIFGAALTLTGCNGDEKQAANRTAAGEILPGSTSDAMLPYDTVRSQAPIAAPVKEVGTAASASVRKPAPVELASDPAEQAVVPALATEPAADPRQ